MTVNDALQLLCDLQDRIKKGHTAEEVLKYLCDMLTVIARRK